MRKTVFTAVAVGMLTAGLAAPASAKPPTEGGCQEFGANVAFLGQTLRAQFGVTASGVATSGPRAFPTFVVFPEQAACP